MSLQQTVNNVINDYMQNFFQQVVYKYPQITLKELKEMWESPTKSSSTRERRRR